MEIPIVMSELPAHSLFQVTIRYFALRDSGKKVNYKNLLIVNLILNCSGHEALLAFNKMWTLSEM